MAVKRAINLSGEIGSVSLTSGYYAVLRMESR